MLWLILYPTLKTFSEDKDFSNLPSNLDLVWVFWFYYVSLENLFVRFFLAPTDHRRNIIRMLTFYRMNSSCGWENIGDYFVGGTSRFTFIHIYYIVKNVFKFWLKPLIFTETFRKFINPYRNLSYPEMIKDLMPLAYQDCRRRSDRCTKLEDTHSSRHE